MRFEQDFKDAVARGDIYWHALPFNAELELMDASLLEAAVQLTHEVDAQLGLPSKITMSQVLCPPEPVQTCQRGRLHPAALAS